MNSSTKSLSSVIAIFNVDYREREEKVVEIRQNIHESIYDLVTNMSTLRPLVSLAEDASKISADYIRSLGPEEPSSYTQVSSQFAD